MLTFGENIHNLNNDIDCINQDLRKGTKYIKTCEDNVCKMWKNGKLQSQHKKDITCNMTIEESEHNRNR